MPLVVGLESVEIDPVQQRPQLRRHVPTVDADGARERHVIRAGRVELHALRIHAEQPSEERLLTRRLVAEAEERYGGPEAGHRLAHDLHGVGVVQQDRAVAADLLQFLGDLHHDRHGPQGHGEPARPRRLLAQHPVVHRDPLVQAPRLEPAGAERREHHIRPLHRSQAVRVPHDANVAGAPRSQDPFAQAPLQIHGLLVDVLQHHGRVDERLARVHDAEGDARHVRGSSADHDDARAHAATLTARASAREE